MEHIFRRYRPEVVFHAAAHKHVHLMERAPGEAIKNNCLGTYIAADMAEKYGTERFILISTDKAVRPTGIMGASKRFCELAVECRRDSHTVFSAVRFGNVIGSRGSVVPLFLRQIKEGGPITITDKRMMRYFMSVSEAVGLVMQAGVMADRGELFVLDMGRPVSILALAEKMIRLSGLEPYRDIDIVEIGLRRGERLFEELLLAGESVEMTSNRMIYIERDKPLGRDRVDELMTMLLDAISEEDENTAARVRAVFKQAVPEYTPLCD
jgi:FlaA1/EpsC-like NDP-sugar epimerase